MDDRKDYSKIRLTASRAIRQKCLDCCCWQESEVKLCHIKKCPLWRWRMGREQKDDLYTKTNRGFRSKKAEEE